MLTKSGTRSVPGSESIGSRPPPSDEFWALSDVSFDVYRGEVLGIIGRNGSGKSTLLKLISRIMHPTHGRIAIRGSVRSLLEIGTGFHHELTGRENIFMNGGLLGMSRSEVTRKLDEIVAFSECEDFLDVQVKYYSSGMYVRLAFAVASQLDPAILIVDEVLAVGDAEFQQKCLKKMEAVSRQGKTVLIVSHSLPVITNLCHRALLLNDGKMVAIGDSQDIVRTYMARVRTAPGEALWPANLAPGNDDVRLRAVKILQDGIDGATADVDISKDILIEIHYESLKPGQRLLTTLWLKDPNRTFVLSTSNDSSNAIQEESVAETASADGSYCSTCVIPGNLLNEGRYVISVLIGHSPKTVVINEESVLSFDVHDTGTMHKEFVGNWAGPLVRPRLGWNTIQLEQWASANGGTSIEQ